jgi:hypothetical protein
MNHRAKIFVVILLMSSRFIDAQVFQQQCNPSFFTVDTVGNEINWEQFPDFSLPFTVVYHGVAPSDSLLHPLHKGFSHIAGPGIDYKDTVWPDHRAYTWTNIVNADGWAAVTNQPWRIKKALGITTFTFTNKNGKNISKTFGQTGTNTPLLRK